MRHKLPQASCARSQRMEDESRASDGPWFVYLLECADKTLYCGVTTDLVRRLAEHNGEAPGGARYTRPRRPVRLAACAAYPDRSSACKAEARVKRLPRGDKISFLLCEGGNSS